MSGNIALTKILFAGLIGTFLVATLFGVYSSYVVLNNVTISEPYSSAYQNISAQYSEFGDIANTNSDKGLVTKILDFGKNALTGTVNVFVVGLDAIGGFFSIIPVIGNIFSAISQAIPGFSALLGLFTIIIGLYVAMRYIQTVTNKIDLP